MKTYTHIAVNAPEFSEVGKLTIFTGGSISEQGTNNFIGNSTVSGGRTLGTYTLSDLIPSVNQEGSEARQLAMTRKSDMTKNPEGSQESFK